MGSDARTYSPSPAGSVRFASISIPPPSHPSPTRRSLDAHSRASPRSLSSLPHSDLLPQSEGGVSRPRTRLVRRPQDHPPELEDHATQRGPRGVAAVVDRRKPGLEIHVLDRLGQQTAGRRLLPRSTLHVRHPPEEHLPGGLCQGALHAQVRRRLRRPRYMVSPTRRHAPHGRTWDRIRRGDGP